MLYFYKKTLFYCEVKKMYEEHFCFFKAYHVKRDGDFNSGNSLGLTSPRLAYIVQGNCEMMADNGSRLSLKSGDIWFLPIGIPYKSHWKTNSFVEFYFFEFEADFVSYSYSDFEVLDGTNMLANFERIYRFSTQSRSFAALSEVYKILDTILPKLHRSETVEKAILPALFYIRTHAAEPIKVEELARMCYLSPSRFYVVFKSATGSSPIDYKNAVKLSRAEKLLQNGCTLGEVCSQLGFSSPAFLRRLMLRHLGKSPKEIKSQLTLI